MARPLSILFPMAGDGMRFGGTFKPLLDATEKKFIELAVEPFQIYEGDYDVTYYFVYRQDQEDQYHVASQLEALFPGKRKQIVLLPRKTLGPLDTITTACRLIDITGPIIICDCDHSIPQDEMKQAITSNDPDVVIPTWNYASTEYASWSKVTMNHDRHPLTFHEKEAISAAPSYLVEGMIGCHYLRTTSLLSSVESRGNLSDLFPVLLDAGKTILCVPVKQASFFGTPAQLAAFRYDRAQKQTFFVDIDGTLLHLSQHISYDSDPSSVLPGTVEKLSQWRQQGHHVVLVTGRETRRRARLEKQLADLKIPYDQLITGLPSGPRVVINDKKPYSVLLPMSQAVQLRRNEGIARVEVETTPTLLKTLHGGSFAQVFLVQLPSGKKVVRKFIEKRPEAAAHVDVLRRQYEDMKRMAFWSPSLVPTMLKAVETSDEYYYDMEYLEGCVEVNACTNEVIAEVIERLYRTLCRDVYVYRGPVDGKAWMEQYVAEKIKAKYKSLESFGPLFASATNDAFVVINGETYKGLCHYFATEDLSEHLPHTLSPIHGDMTLNNVLYHPETKDIRLIDPAGSRYVDAPELDMSKLLQDAIARVFEWPQLGDKLVHCNEAGEFTIPASLMVPNDSFDFVAALWGRSVKTARFYLATHLIRMVPYTFVNSPDHALCALLYALAHMH